jgi:YHS domain-containing protein
MKQIIEYLIFFSIVAGQAQSGSAQANEVRASHFNVSRGVAIHGYDPVSYFDGKPKEGKADLRWTYKGVAYQFASQANLDRFKASPDKFEPAYGGWCAYAMGEKGEKVKIDPLTYKVHEGRLHLFYNFWGNNTLNPWNKDERNLKEAGDLNWRKIIEQ